MTMTAIRPSRAAGCAAALLAVTLLPAAAIGADRVKTATGTVEGTQEESGVRTFKGIPYAAPPVGDLRWKPPQAAVRWDGVRQANAFGPRCMQRPVFNDMVFRSNGMSEDCLYLNVWTPKPSPDARLPVLVYFYGGGFVGGDGSEPRYDGEAMARKGIVALTVNYRLNVFGFFSHPELTQESPRHASGNQGLLDQAAALRWVQENIAAFGGDPKKVTIAGESAGSISVSALMASPLTKDLIAGAIGESGAAINPTLPPVPLEQAQQAGATFATGLGAATLAALRALPAEQVLEATGKPDVPRFMSAIDGYFFTKLPADTFAAGEQAHVPLLAGWNSQESNFRAVLGPDAAPTAENYDKALEKLYGDQASEAKKLYPGSSEEEIAQSATDLASDRFIAFSTWKWLDLHGKTGGSPVYRYFYSRPRPATQAEPSTSPARGAAHSAEIEYAMGNLAGNKVYTWTADDQKVSEIMHGYFVNFVKTGDPNGQGLPDWPAANRGDTVQVMHIDVNTRVEPERTRDRYLFLDRIYSKK